MSRSLSQKKGLPRLPSGEETVGLGQSWEATQEAAGLVVQVTSLAAVIAVKRVLTLLRACLER